jgi:hypothetical protein
VSIPASTPAATGSGDLGAPLYIAWQVTNECNLACLHCIEESGPGKAFPDELDDEQVFAVLEQVVELEVPYLSFSGGEPMVHRRFFDMAEYVCQRNGQLKVETNGHYLGAENCARLKEIGVKAVQVSLDGATREPSTACGCAEFRPGVQGVKTRQPRAASRPLLAYVFNAHEIGSGGSLSARAAFLPGARCTNAVKTAPMAHRKTNTIVFPDPAP